MKQPLLIRLFGPNYRVRITGLITVVMGSLGTLAALPYTLGDVAMWIPPDLKPIFLKVCGGAAVISKIFNVFYAKSSNVSGNSADGQTVASKGEVVAVVPATPVEEPKPPTP